MSTEKILHLCVFEGNVSIHAHIKISIIYFKFCLFWNRNVLWKAKKCVYCQYVSNLYLCLTFTGEVYYTINIHYTCRWYFSQLILNIQGNAFFFCSVRIEILAFPKYNGRVYLSLVFVSDPERLHIYVTSGILVFFFLRIGEKQALNHMSQFSK